MVKHLASFFCKVTMKIYFAFRQSAKNMHNLPGMFQLHMEQVNHYHQRSMFQGDIYLLLQYGHLMGYFCLHHTRSNIQGHIGLLGMLSFLCYNTTHLQKENNVTPPLCTWTSIHFFSIYFHKESKIGPWDLC